MLRMFEIGVVLCSLMIVKVASHAAMPSNGSYKEVS